MDTSSDSADDIATLRTEERRVRRLRRQEKAKAAAASSTLGRATGAPQPSVFAVLSAKDKPMPRVLDELRGVRLADLACGTGHSLIASEAGDVYGWGWNYHGQLGQQPDGANGGSHFVLSAVEMDMGDVGAATAVAAGDLYSAAVG